jgi:hypothetical protein
MVRYTTLKLRQPLTRVTRVVLMASRDGFFNPCLRIATFIFYTVFLPASQDAGNRVTREPDNIGICEI